MTPADLIRMARDAMPEMAPHITNDELERFAALVAAAERGRLHTVNKELLEALKNLEKEFRRVYPIYYYAEPWGHEINVPLQAARAAIAKAEGQA